MGTSIIKVASLLGGVIAAILQIQQSHFSILIKIISTIGSVVISGGYFYQTKRRKEGTNARYCFDVGRLAAAPSSQRQAACQTKHWTVPPTRDLPPPPPQINANARRSCCGHAIIGTSNTRFRVRWTSKRSQGTILDSRNPTHSTIFMNNIGTICSWKSKIGIVRNSTCAPMIRTSFHGKFVLARSCDPTASTYVPFTSVKTNGTLLWTFWRFKRSSRHREEAITRRISQISRGTR